jgi:undecaprenyl-diphosphatase
MLLLFFGLTFGVTDYLASSVIKPSVQRLRPCNDPGIKTDMNLLIACGSGYSFPSTHAANHFALAFFLINMFYRRWKPILPLVFLWAFAVSFAQVYLGVHYPLDITFGAAIGALIGSTMGGILKTTQAFKTWKSGN